MLGNVLFNIFNIINNIWYSYYVGGFNLRMLIVDVGLFGVIEVYILINIYWGKIGGLVFIEFYGLDDVYYKKILYGNFDI